MSHPPPKIFSEGLGGCVWGGGCIACPEEVRAACAIFCPEDVANSLAPRKTQIIPPKLMAAAGVRYTHKDLVAGKEVIFSINTGWHMPLRANFKYGG